jgi:hypothetical protein
MPPSTDSTLLVRYPFSSIATAKAANSSVSPRRPTGMDAVKARASRVRVHQRHAVLAHERRSEHVHGHAVAGDQRGEVMGEAVQSGLARRIVGAEGTTDPCRERRHEEDSAPGSLDHQRQCSPGHQVGSAQVEPDRLVELGTSDFIPRPNHAGACVRDEQVDGAHALSD